jgi:sulfonate transport system substrate-binding protein
MQQKTENTRRRARRISRGAGATLALGLLASVVGAGSSFAATASPKLSAHRSTDQSVNLSGVTLNVGTFLYDGWEGELDAAGLQNTPYTVNWVGLNSGFLQISAAEAGSIQLGSASFIPPIFAASNPTTAASISLVAQSVGNTALQDVIVPGNSGDKSVHSLVGQTVGYVSNVTDEYFLAKALQNADIPWSSIKAVAFQTPANGLAALESGAVQALATYGTTITTAQESIGAKVLINGGPILSAVTGSNGLLGDAVAQTSALSNKAESAAIADLLARINAAEGWARAHPDQWSTIVSAATDGTTTVPQEVQLFTAGEKQINTQIEPVTRVAVAGEQRAANTLAADDLIPNAVDTGTLWTTKLNSLLATDIPKYLKGHPTWVPKSKKS